MVEVRYAIRRYAESKPYRISRVREPDEKKSRKWRYQLMMDAVDPMLVMMLGDFIHNLRSALDHVVVGNSLPKYRHSAGFPVEARDLFETRGGDFVLPDDDARESFNNAIRGLPFLLKTAVIESQPYRSESRNTHIIGILSRLENIDKHKKAIGIFPALRGSIRISVRGAPYRTLTLDRKHFFYGGAEVYSFTRPRGSTLTESEVDMECSGPAAIVIKGTGIPGHPGLLEIDLAQTMLIALSTVRVILRAMDGAARHPASFARRH
jgi:hypothetical protein